MTNTNLKRLRRTLIVIAMLLLLFVIMVVVTEIAIGFHAGYQQAN